MKSLRAFLFLIVLLSLLAVPYSLIAYLCYLGLCGGNPAGLIAKHYTSFYGYFTWIYPGIAFLALFISRIFKNNNLRLSIIFLMIPLICFLPFIYVEFKAHLIAAHYRDEVRAVHTVKPTDYACAPGKFIRETNQVYYYFDYDTAGNSGSMSAFYSLAQLKAHFATSSISLTTCKNQLGELIK